MIGLLWIGIVVAFVAGLVAVIRLMERDQQIAERRLTRQAATAWLNDGGDPQIVQRWFDAGAPSMFSRAFSRAQLGEHLAGAWLNAYEQHTCARRPGTITMRVR